MKIGLIGALVLLGLGAQTPAAAQQTQRPQRSQLERQVRERFRENVRRRVGLEDEEFRRLGRVMDEFRRERSVLAARERSLRGRIRNALAEMEEGRELAPADARALLGEMSSLAAEEARLFEDEQVRLLEILSPAQLLVFYRLREELANRIRRLQDRGR